MDKNQVFYKIIYRKVSSKRKVSVREEEASIAWLKISEKIQKHDAIRTKQIIKVSIRMRITRCS